MIKHLILIVLSTASLADFGTLEQHCDKNISEISIPQSGETYIQKNIEVDAYLNGDGINIESLASQCNTVKNIIIKSDQETTEYVEIQLHAKTHMSGSTLKTYKDLIDNSCPTDILYPTIKVVKKSYEELKSKIISKFCKRIDNKSYQTSRFPYRDELDLRHSYLKNIYSIPMEIGSQIPFYLYSKSDQRALFQNAFETKDKYSRHFYLYRADKKRLTYLESNTFLKDHTSVSLTPASKYSWSLGEGLNTDKLEGKVKVNIGKYNKTELKDVLFDLIHKKTTPMPTVYFLGQRVNFSKRELHYRIQQYINSEGSLIDEQ